MIIYNLTMLCLLGVAVLTLKLSVAFRTTKMPTENDVQPPKFAPDTSKDTFEWPVVKEQAKYYHKTDGRSPGGWEKKE